MGFGDLWNRMLVYFGIAEDEDWDEDGYQTNGQLEENYGRRDRHPLLWTTFEAQSGFLVS